MDDPGATGPGVQGISCLPCHRGCFRCDRAAASAARVAVPAPSWLSRCCHACLSLIVVGVTLAGCALADGPGQFAVDPGLYELYHCNDLVRQLKYLQERESE
jgi:hypothetical protein